MALRNAPEDVLSFLRATLAPATLRRTVEELLIDPFISTLADAGRAGWTACAPLVVANVEIGRIKKKYDVIEKREVAEREGAAFVFDKVRPSPTSLVVQEGCMLPEAYDPFRRTRISERRRVVVSNL